MTVLYFWRRTREERNRECDSILGAVSHKAKGFVASARISLSPAEDLSESNRECVSILGAVRGFAPSANLSFSVKRKPQFESNQIASFHG